MPIPTYDVLMLPVLRLCAEKLWVMRDLVARVADDLGLSQSEREQMIPSGSMTIATSRVHWAKTYLKQAGLVEQPTRAHVQISARGREVLARNPSKIDSALLQGFEEFRDFLSRTKSEDTPLAITAIPAVLPTPAVAPVAETTNTPEEQIATASLTLNESLRDALLARVLEGNPTFFEKLIVDLLLAMGYGGSRSDAGEQLGGTGDGGVDGVIREDQLGLDRVYLQAKRYQPGNTVGSEAVQAFMGALVSKGAQKGVLITTSTFSKAAIQVAGQSGHLRLVLINGDELTKLMVRFGVGVRVTRTVEIKRIDLDYFEDAEPE
ncbi:restriction endonuclease [Acidisphaera sp. L21]|uniref:restriction endonuclease n=1 Tax=Acidisphaera sp. L21 TaxID=1641851 RepID=UPI00131E809A|nr:restriction endonuclease [Acidisphaera sp. L21]